MQEKINELKKKIADAIKDVHSSDSLFQIKMKFLGKSGEVSEVCATFQKKNAPK